jgi:redox-sensitive bicupin YhaK (pirin superfamily)
MMTIRRADERGRASFGWLDSRHSFSFGHYHDPRYMGFGPLRVINEDRVVPGGGFDTHGHRDMEIISYVLDGALKHEDSMGNGSVIRPGDVQRMSAGTGVMHSEFNASDRHGVHFLQIWVLPEAQGIEPGYEQKAFARDDKLNRLRLVASRDGRDGSVVVHQDVDLYASVLEQGRAVRFEPQEGRRIWIQLASGAVSLNGEALRAGDGVAAVGPAALVITAGEDSELLLFDMGG